MTNEVLASCALCGHEREMYGMYQHLVIKLCKKCCGKILKGIIIRDINMIDYGKPVTIRVFGTLDGWGIEPDEQVKKFALELGWKWDIPCFTKEVNPENFRALYEEADRIRQKIYRRAKKHVMKHIELGYLTQILTEKDIPVPYGIPISKSWKVISRRRSGNKFTVLVAYRNMNARLLASELNGGKARYYFGIKLGDKIIAESDGTLSISTSYPEHWEGHRQALEKILPGRIQICPR